MWRSTRAGIMLYVGAIGNPSTVAIHSILYETGCAPVTARQNGLLPVLTTVNLTAANPPPHCFQNLLRVTRQCVPPSFRFCDNEDRDG